MEHIYKNIDGWFDFSRFYDSVIDRLPNGFVFVEVGVWKGKSLSYFVIESINKNKSGSIYAVDHWLGSEEHQKNSWAHDPVLDYENGLYNEYCRNISSIRNYITDIKDSSINASNRFSDSSLDAIFIDASHDYDNVSQDLLHWKNKLKKTGILAGHDYDWPTVKMAVNNFANQNDLFVASYQSVWELTPA